MGFSSFNCAKSGISIPAFEHAGLPDEASHVVMVTPNNRKINGWYDGYMNIIDEDGKKHFIYDEIKKDIGEKEFKALSDSELFNLIKIVRHDFYSNENFDELSTSPPDDYQGYFYTSEARKEIIDSLKKKNPSKKMNNHKDAMKYYYELYAKALRAGDFSAAVEHARNYNAVLKRAGGEKANVGEMYLTMGKKGYKLKNPAPKKVIDLIFYNDFNGKIASLAAKLPKVFKGIAKSENADVLFGGVNDFEVIFLSNNKRIVFIDTPQHGFFFDDKGTFIGEEDEMLIGKWTKYNEEVKDHFRKEIERRNPHCSVYENPSAQKRVKVKPKDRKAVSAKISKLIREGKSQEQAVAIALNMYGKHNLGPRGGQVRNPASKIDELGNKVLQNFLKKYDAKVTHKKVEGELPEVHLGNTTYLYGNGELLAYTDKYTFIWLVDRYGDRYSFELFEVLNENDERVKNPKNKSAITYRIIRFYKEGHRPKVMATGLTRKEAQAWCSDPETSSKTCEEPENIEHTTLYGDWFDGFEEE